MISIFTRRFRRFLPSEIQKADLELFRKVAESHVPILDWWLPRLSRWANKSMLWFAIAAVLASAGGRFGRRAAFRGILSIGAASAVVNLPGKMLTRRRRPPGDIVPVARRLARMPASSSFPSGHSASAFAFATAASMEQPLIGPALGVLATGVAVSRVYTGAHYPTDVMVGAAVGAGVAVASQKLWPLASHEPARARPVRLRSHVEPSPEGEGLVVAVNPSAGSKMTRSPTDELREQLPAAKIIEAGEDQEFDEVLRKAVDDETRALGVAGGDGSVNAAVGIALEQDKPLLVVPSGTLNHLARDLGLSSITDAVDAIREGQTIAVDVGRIDGRPFINTASFGKYVDLVDERYRLESRVGKWPALLIALVKVFRQSNPLTVEIDGRRRRIWVIFIGNCRYEPSGMAPSHRHRMDDETLDIRILTAERKMSRTRAVLGLLTGNLARSGVYEEMSARTIKVKSLEGPLRLARDGETFDGSVEFEVAKAEERVGVFVTAE